MFGGRAPRAPLAPAEGGRRLRRADRLVCRGVAVLLLCDLRGHRSRSALRRLHAHVRAPQEHSARAARAVVRSEVRPAVLQPHLFAGAAGCLVHAAARRVPLSRRGPRARHRGVCRQQRTPVYVVGRVERTRAISRSGPAMSCADDRDDGVAGAEPDGQGADGGVAHDQRGGGDCGRVVARAIVSVQRPARQGATHRNHSGELAAGMVAADIHGRRLAALDRTTRSRGSSQARLGLR